MLSINEGDSNSPETPLEQDAQNVPNSEPVNTNHAEPSSTPGSGMAVDKIPGRRERRKRKVVEIGGLNDCLCGSRAVSTADDVIQCKRVGCETVWVSNP